MPENQSSREPSADARRNELLARAKAGDQQARQALFDRRREATLKKLIRRRLRHRSQLNIDSNDVVQMVRMQIFRTKRAEAFDSAKAFHQFICVVAERAILKVYRSYLGTQRRDRQRDVPLEGIVGGPKEPINPEMTPFEAAAHEDVLDRLFAEMSPVEKFVVMGRRQGYSLAELARLVDKPEYVTRYALSIAAKRYFRLIGVPVD